MLYILHINTFYQKRNFHRFKRILYILHFNSVNYLKREKKYKGVEVYEKKTFI